MKHAGYIVEYGLRTRTLDLNMSFTAYYVCDIGKISSFFSLSIVYL